MNFLKTIFASAIGFLIAAGLIFVVGIIIVVGAVVSLGHSFGTTSEFTVKPESVLSINLEGEIVEHNTNDAAYDISVLLYEDINDVPELGLGLDQIQNAISQACMSKEIEGIFLNVSDMVCGSATANEIYGSLIKFKRSTGKFVYAYIDRMASQEAYLVATAADSIFMNPLGSIALHGYASTPLFYTGAFKKLGVEPQVFKVGTFKSAVEPYTETKMSDANRMQTQSYLNSLWNDYTAAVAYGRGLDVKKINAVADGYADLLSAEDLLDMGLIDAVGYKADVTKLLLKRCGTDVRKLNLVSVRDFLSSSASSRYIDNKSQFSMTKNLDKPNGYIAVVYAEGQIYSTPNASGLISGRQQEIVSTSMIRHLENLKSDSLVKGVVLRINSPGGDAYASEQICHAVTELNRVKPVVVSMGDYAASGGYYIASNASVIVAQPTTITGSIGIFGIAFTAEQLTSRLGLTSDCVKTNKHSDFGMFTRSMTQSEKTLMQSYVNRGYKVFVERCSEGRNMSGEDIEKIAQGRVWSGRQAYDIGLVDTLGNIDMAISIAANLAGDNELNRWVLRYPFKKTDMERVSEMLAGIKGLNTRLSAKEILRENVEYLKRNSGVMAIMPQYEE